MKTVLLSGLALLATAHVATAQVLASDDFSYVGPLTSNGWVAHSGAGAKTIMSDGSVATLDQSGGSGEDDNLPFTPQGSTDTTYFSFTLNVPSGNPVNVDGDGLYFAHLKNSGTYYHARVTITAPAAAGDFGLGISNTSSITAGVVWASDLAFDTDYQVVCSWDATTDTATMWLDPASSGDTSIVTVGTYPGDLMEGFALRQSNDYTGYITVDNVIVGKTFGDVSGGTSGPGVAYCFGDGTGTACPCGNNNDGSIGGAGCDNGVFASGAQLGGTGVASLSNDTLVLQAINLEPNNSGLYFQANNDLSPGNVWGDGLQCAGGQLKRLGVRFADASGASNTSGFAQSISVKAGNIVAGDTKRYQLWYRTTIAPPCGLGVNDFNSTNGYAVTWSL